MNYFILILFISFSLVCESIILDRKQLAVWVPDFNVTKSVQLMYADITSIETNTFDGLTNIQQIILYFKHILYGVIKMRGQIGSGSGRQISAWAK